MNRNNPNYLFMKVEDHYRAALIEFNELNIATKEPAPKAYHLYLFPEMYVPFTEQSLPNVIKYKLGAIGANKEAPRPMYAMTTEEWIHGWRLEGMSGFCIWLTQKVLTDLRRKFLDRAVEPLMTKDQLKHIATAQNQQNYMASQMQGQQAYSNGYTNPQAVYGQMASGAAQSAPSYYGTVGITTTAAAPQGFWSSVGSALGVI